MQIVPTTASPYKLQVPEGWEVEVRPRGPNSCIQSDKYYYEPGTGRKFRSLVSVWRYLNGEEEMLPRKKLNTCMVPYQSSGSFKRAFCGGKVLRPDELEEAPKMYLDSIVASTLRFKAPFWIPDGWIVERIPRKHSPRSDRYFTEPVTGLKFRSLPEVQRYLAGEPYRSKCKALTKCKASTFSNHATAPRSSTPRKKRTAVKMLEGAVFDLTYPPEKVNWVSSGDGQNRWSPLLQECVLPDYVKEQWRETFLMGMNGL